MSISLKEYQKRALASLGHFLERARLEGPERGFETAVDAGLLPDYKPMPGLPDVPYVCLRIPTGGGKTVMGAHIIRTASGSYLEREFPLVMWMVPTTTIKNQTLDAFRDPRHPYRIELDEAFGGRVAVFDTADFAQIRPADLGTKVCLVIGTLAALRVNDKEGRKVYEHHEDLEPHFAGSAADLPYLDRDEKGSKVLASFANLLRMHGPLVIMDEAHNATTPLSYEVYERLGPRAVVELTATPDGATSNVLVSVSALELKAEDMIKFPVILTEHEGDWRKAINSAFARRNTLAEKAFGEPEYIRPLLLIQAENSRGVATVAEVKTYLTDVLAVPEKAIAIATGEMRELDGVDLFAKDCPIHFIITKQALKEGWDCAFAYVFASVAQVKSDKDVQQLLGRVLRMPYAKPRAQEAMSRAYAHVVSDSFGQAAAELTQSLVNIGFNPIEAATAVRREPEQGRIDLAGGTVRAKPTIELELPKAPDLSQVPAGDHDRIKIIPRAEGKGVVVEVTDEIDDQTVEALVLTAPKGQRDDVAAALAQHHHRVRAAKSPSENGVILQIPRLYSIEQGELDLLQAGAREEGVLWDPLPTPPDLSTIRVDEQTMTFEVALDGQTVAYHRVKDDVATYLPGFAADRTLADLVGWLDQEVRDPGVKQPVKREWIRRAVQHLTERRGFSLAQLLQGQFVLARKLREQLDLARSRAYSEGFQRALFGGGMEVVVPDGPDHSFTYDPDHTKYPARFFYDGPFRFQKHYYPYPGDLRWRTGSGQDSEEFLCAQAIDMLDEVEVWCRNLVHPTQFWMPTSKQRTYPDFTAKLTDGRLLIVEYKGLDRFTADQEEEKRLVGDLWSKRSGGRGLYLMAVKRDEKGRGVREQLLAAIRGERA